MFYKALSKCFGVFASLKLPNFLIIPLIKSYAFIFKINTSHANKKISEYDCLDSFFVRNLKPEHRPVSSSGLISPADGKIVEVGSFSEDKSIELKGLGYSLIDLFAGHKSHKKFSEGCYSVIYLSPSDYHCVHSAISGSISKSIFISGNLRTVNPSFSSSLSKTLVENERVITLVDSEDYGEVATIMVGATNVGSIEMSYLEMSEHPKVSLSTAQKIVKDIGFENTKNIKKGELLGKFHLGSTVIICFQEGRVRPQMLRGFECAKDFEKIQYGQNLLLK